MQTALGRDKSRQATQNLDGVAQEVLFIGNVKSAFQQPKKWTRSKPISKVRSGDVTRRNRFAVFASPDEDSGEVQRICKVESLDVQGEEVVCRLIEDCKIDQVVHQQGEWVRLGAGEITVDSAADESCWPLNEGGAFEIRASRRNLLLKAANGAILQHLGEKEVIFKDRDSGEVLGMTFQVTEVRKPLAAVWRLVEKGNLVQFGPNESQCFIQNLASGKRIPLHKRGGSYVLKVEYVKWVPVFQGHA